MRNRQWWQEFIDSSEPIDEVEYELLMAAVRGLLCGDLLPLAEYLKRGYPLHYMLRRDLVDAIEGRSAGDLYTLRFSKNRPGAGDALSPLQQFIRRFDIHDEFERQLQIYGGNTEAATAATAEKCDASRTAVFDARKAVKEFLGAALSD